MNASQLDSSEVVTVTASHDRRRRGPNGGIYINPCVRLAFLIIVLVISTDAAAQSPPSASSQASRVQVGIGGLVSTAVGGFGTNIDHLGGVVSHFSVHLRSVLTLGAEGSLSFYGTEDRPLAMTTIPEAQYFFVEHYMMSTHARLGVQPRSGRWRPHAEALVGIKWIATDTTVSGKDSIDDDDSVILDYAINSSDLGLSYGVGAGVTMGRSASSRWRVDVAVRYLSGSVADYLTKGAISGPFRQETLDVSRSRTDTVAVYIGLEWDARGTKRVPPPSVAGPAQAAGSQLRTLHSNR